MVKRWLITGGCGFIGRNLVSRLLLEQNYFIRIVDNLKVGSKEDLREVCDFVEVASDNVATPTDLHPGVELIVADILDAELAHKLCEGFDVIVHLAANTGVAPSVENPRMDCMTNIVGTLNYLEAARCCKITRFVFASSGAPVGEVQPPIHEEIAPHPVSPYGASKLAGEGYCSSYFHTFGIETVCLRFGNVYGPLSGNKDSVVAKFIKGALNGQTLEIYGDGTQTRDFIFVEDLIEAILLAVSKPNIGGETFQIATSYETTVRELLTQLLAILSNRGVKNFRVIHGENRRGDVKRNYSDTRKAQKLLGWDCKNDLAKGLEKTVAWFYRDALL